MEHLDPFALAQALSDTLSAAIDEAGVEKPLGQEVLRGVLHFVGRLLAYIVSENPAIAATQQLFLACVHAHLDTIVAEYLAAVQGEEPPETDNPRLMN